MNKTWKKLLCMALSAVMVLGLAACGGSKTDAPAAGGDSAGGDAAPAADPIVLKMSTAQPEEHIASQTALRFADLIEQGTNGAVTVKMYFATKIGSEVVYLDKQVFNAS